MRTVNLACGAVGYELRRYRRSRHVRIHARRPVLLVTAPPAVPVRDVEAVLREHEGWIAAQLAARPTTPALADGTLLPLLDGEVELGIRRGRDDRCTDRRDEGRLALEVTDPTTAAVLVESWYRALAAGHFRELSDGFASRLGVSYERLQVRDARTRWASCSSRGTLSFSWRLMMAPWRVGAYVAAHEVSHLVEPNHSPAFWSTVARLWPGYREDRAWLQANGPSLSALEALDDLRQRLTARPATPLLSRAASRVARLGRVAE